MKSIDGFTRHDRIPRRPRSEEHALKAPLRGISLPRPVHSSKGRADHHEMPRQRGHLENKPIDFGTLPQVDIEETPSRPKKRGRFLFWRRKKERKPWSRRKKIIFWVLLIIILAGAGVAAYLGWKVFNTTSQIFQGNVLKAVFQNQPLKQDANGRTNILLFGTSEDDPGHGGAELTDSIMVVSLDQKKHDAYIVSVPRDLWVKYGKACNSGYEGKINEVYLCGKGETNENAGQAALRTKVGEVFGIDLQYSVHVNYQVLKKSVDALGGVNITIESSDPRGILDRNFDWRCNYSCYLVKHANGPAHLNGEQALFLAQARNDAGGYGLPRGNFDREANQRKIMIAAKEKAASAGFLANPVKVTQLIDSLGENVRSNIQAAEIKTFIDVAKKTDTKNIVSISLVDEDPAPLTTGSAPTGASIVRPVKGIYDFSGLHSLVNAYFTGNGALLREKATVDVLNGTDTPGLGQAQADKLAGEGLKIGLIGNAPSTGTYGKVKLFDLSKGEKPATKKKLEQVLGVVATTEAMPSAITSDSPFVVVVGQ